MQSVYVICLAIDLHVVWRW